METNLKQFPRTTVANISLSRMLIGTNWMLGYSHRGEAADSNIRSQFSDTAPIIDILGTFLHYGIDTLMAPVSSSPILIRAIQESEQKFGKKLILVDTPILNMDDTTQGRAEAEAAIAASKKCGSTFCLIHHSSAEQLVNKNKGAMDRLDDYTKMIRDAGLIPGLSAHMPELIVYADENGYDIETYIQIYNCQGFLMQIEVETVASIIHQAKKPVMTIKSMAAGRCTPYVGLNFSWATLRDCDMVTVGCFSPQEAEEDIEISFAAFEGRFPRFGKRASPNTTQAVFG